MDVGEHGVHFGLEGKPGRENGIVVANEGKSPGEWATTEATNGKCDFEVIGSVCRCVPSH
jgi:hypothetical protein